MKTTKVEKEITEEKLETNQIEEEANREQEKQKEEELIKKEAAEEHKEETKKEKKEKSGAEKGTFKIESYLKLTCNLQGGKTGRDQSLVITM